MGNSVFSIHTRNRATNAYEEDKKLNLSENTSLDVALGVFKREVFMMALGREWESAKAIYLYNGWKRVARAECADKRMAVVFANKVDRLKFLSVREKLTGIRWPLAADGFYDRWTRLDDGGSEGCTLSFAARTFNN